MLRDRGLNAPARIGLLLFGIALLALPSNALARPSISWQLPKAASEGQPVAFSWMGSHLGKKHRLVIQKPEGTAHTWRSILRLPTHSGSAELPPMPLGKYRLRIADLSGHRVLAQQVAGIGVFGQVPFSTLFQGSEHDQGVFAGPSYSFPYVGVWEDGGTPAFTVQRNHCVSVHIAFVTHLGSSYGTPGIGIVTLVQESRDPISGSSPFDAIGSLDASVIPGQSWAVNISAQQEKEGEDNTYLNGYALCDSTEPFS